MVAVTGLNGAHLAINSDLIEHMEATPDTVITFTTGNKLIVRESIPELTSRVVSFRRSVSNPSKRAEATEYDVPDENAGEAHDE